MFEHQFNAHDDGEDRPHPRIVLRDAEALVGLRTAEAQGLDAKLAAMQPRGRLLLEPWQFVAVGFVFGACFVALIALGRMVG